MISYLFRNLISGSALQRTLRSHFEGLALAEIVTAARDFPITSRVDLQAALDETLANRSGTRLVGLHSPMDDHTPTLAHLFAPGPFQVDLGPLQHDELDVGDEVPTRCLRNGLWLSRQGGLPFAVLVAVQQYGPVSGVHLEAASSRSRVTRTTRDAVAPCRRAPPNQGAPVLREEGASVLCSWATISSLRGFCSRR